MRLHTVVVLAFFAGFLGGLSSTHLFEQRPLIQSEALKVLEVQELRIVDADGVTRGIFRTRDDGTVGLALSNQYGVDLVALGVLPGGASIVALGDSLGQVRLMLGVSEERSLLEISDLDERGRVRLEVNNEKDEARLLVNDKATKGEATWGHVED